MTIKDGGPVAPHAATVRQIASDPECWKEIGPAHVGMSIRQFYKAHAQSLCAAVIFATPGGGSPDAGQLAKLCGEFADAQIAEDAEFSAKAGAP